MIGQGQTGWLASAQSRECDLGGHFVNASRGYWPTMHYCSFAIGHWSTWPLPLALCFPATSFRVALLRRPCRDRHAGPWGREAWIHWTQHCALRLKASRAPRMHGPQRHCVFAPTGSPGAWAVPQPRCCRDCRTPALALLVSPCTIGNVPICPNHRDRGLSGSGLYGNQTVR